MRLALITWLAGGLCLVAIVLGNGGIATRTILFLALCITGCWIKPRVGAAAGSRLIVYPDGRCRLDDREGVLGPDSWFTGWYCVVACEIGGKARKTLISAGRQDPREYRKLSGWLRLRNHCDP